MTPNFRSIRESSIRIRAFGGLNLTSGANEGASYSRAVNNCELSDEKNMTGMFYPSIGVRPKRHKRIICDDNDDVWLPSVEATYNNGLFYIAKNGQHTHSGSFAYFRGKRIDGWNLTLEEHAGEHRFANMGSKIIIIPEGIYFDTQAYLDKSEDSSLSDFAGKIEITKTQEEYSNTLMYPCFSDGTVASSYPSGKNFPAEYGYTLDLGVDDEIIATYNEDKSDINIYRYQKNTGRYTFETDKVVKISCAEIGTGFSVGEYIELSGVEIARSDSLNGTYKLDLGDSGKIIECDKDYLTVRLSNVYADSYAKFCNQWTNSGSSSSPFCALVRFKIKRFFPKLKYVCEWNNRLWGCGGENNNTIFACALGNVCLWSSYENTAGDSYWANVDSCDEWTGAFTFGDHAYFFKNEKCYKMYGTRPSNFSYSELNFGTNDDRSICSCKNAMYFAKYDGIYATSGTVAYKVSDKLGHEMFRNFQAFSLDGRLYVYCYRDEKRHLYTFDTTNGLWHDEDLGYLACAVKVPKDVIIIGSNDKSDDVSAYSLNGTTGFGYRAPDSATTDDKVAWFFDTQDFCVYGDKAVFFPRITADLSLEAGGKLSIKAMYDSNGIWKEVKNVVPCSRKSILIMLSQKRSHSVKLRFEGEGVVEIYGLNVYMQGGSMYGIG